MRAPASLSDSRVERRRHVAPDGERSPPRERLGCPLRGAEVNVGEDNPRAPLSQCGGGRGTESSAGSGEEDHLAGQ